MHRIAHGLADRTCDLPDPHSRSSAPLTLANELDAAFRIDEERAVLFEERRAGQKYVRLSVAVSFKQIVTTTHSIAAKPAATWCVSGSD